MLVGQEARRRSWSAAAPGRSVSLPADGRPAVGTAQRHELRIEAVPRSQGRYSTSAVPSPRCRNPRQVRKRRHVHDDMHGTFALAIASSSSRTPDSVLRLLHRERDEVVFGRLDRVGPSAESLPGSFHECTSTSPSFPLTGMRTRAPAVLNASTSAGRQTSVALWPAARILVARREPYEAPR